MYLWWLALAVSPAAVGQNDAVQAAPPVPPPAATRPAARPAPRNPLAINDSLLALRERQTNPDAFRAAIEATVRRHPATREAEAVEAEARAALGGARGALAPRLDINLSAYRVIARDFSNDPFNIVERSRPQRRTDALITAEQTLIDFGAGLKRVEAAGARVRGADADADVTAGRVALSAIAAWYDVFGYRALVLLSIAYVEDERRLRLKLQERISAGVSADADLAGVDSAIARGNTRLANYRRNLANAEARFRELTGAPAPAGLERAPTPGGLVQTREDAIDAAVLSPPVRSAEATASAARADARATRADRLPLVTGGVDAGRYGVFENDRDYDVRLRLTVRQRLFGGVDATANQSAARAQAAGARADRVREEAARDAAIAFADVRALEDQLAALESAYLASKRAREATTERFAASRGTLFDVLSTQESYFDGATAYLQGLIDLDAARYVLLSQTGRLLPQLAIDADMLGRNE